MSITPENIRANLLCLWPIFQSMGSAGVNGGVFQNKIDRAILSSHKPKIDSSFPKLAAPL